MMLVIFDIDGTLTRTYDLDGAPYARAFVETFGQPLPSREWTTYRHVTDRGIAEVALARLGQALRPDSGRQVAGAAAILDRFLRAASNVGI
jgi:phosphoglycolate phosphatase-like HAD superfamily hydrolase